MVEGKAGLPRDHQDSCILGEKQVKNGESAEPKLCRLHQPLKQPQLKCPECSSQSLYKDGLRYLANGETIQRLLCRNCGYRFSEGKLSHALNPEPQRPLKNNSRWPINTADSIYSNCQVCDETQGRRALVPQTGGYSLVEVETRQEIAQREGTMPSTPSAEAEVLRYLIWLKNQGFSQHTIRSRANLLKWIGNKKADLNDPETVKMAIANANNWCETTKLLATTAYDSFLKWEGKTWIPPRYKQIQKLPFIPTEEELDALIIAGSKRLTTLLQILKETGVRLGEALTLEWTDIDFERNLIRVNHPEKGSNPRILVMSKKLANMINTLPKKSHLVLNRNPKTCETALWNLRRKAAFKLQNPRLQSITFHTFRHWKATTEYHKTHDIFHVQRLLGHRNIQNTAIYITLENGMFQTENNDFHVAVAKTLEDACKLLEVGFEYVCDMHDAKLFRKRK
jgi:integrase